MHQFEIWLANLPYHPDSHVLYGLHPVIVVSNEGTNANSPVITIVPLTSNTNKRISPTHVLITGQGLRQSSIALCEQPMSLDRSYFMRPVGYIENDFDRFAIMHGIAMQFGFTA
ncbi:MAG: type II toxin-antitoxin system PemK/MazF family toxin [Clostridia bacterium]|nr:type II toxin-antitoxin system PemK/MazF family toxin [Clostridia bacterium]